jgi:malate permease and related proteins
MAMFLHILSDIILPILVLALIGFVAQKFLRFDIRTLIRLNLYLFVPAVLFVKVYRAEVSLAFVGIVFGVVTLVVLVMWGLGEGVSGLLHAPRSRRKAFTNSLTFFNSGNYGLPLSELVFAANPLAATVQIFIMLIQNVTGNTFGAYQASSGQSSGRQALKNVLKLPAIYVLVVVGLVKAVGLTMPPIVLLPLDYLSAGFVAMALVTLGAQLAEIRFDFHVRDILLSCLIRLVVAPALCYGLVVAFGLHGVLAQSLILGVSTPTAVNTAILAREYENEHEYASQIVLVSTLLSVVTISVVIFLVSGL